MDDDNILPIKRRGSNIDREDSPKKQKIDTDSSSSTDDEDYIEDYFDTDTTLLRNTMLKHILELLNKNQRDALAHKIRKGIDNAFNLYEKLIAERFDPLTEDVPTTNLWKLGMGPSEITKYQTLIQELRTKQVQSTVNITQILKCDVDNEKKCTMLNMFDALQMAEKHSIEYHVLNSQLLEIIKETDGPAKQQVALENRLKQIIGSTESLKTRILTADIDDARKAAIYEKYILLQKSDDSASVSTSLEEWIEEALKTPFNKIAPSPFIDNADHNPLLLLKQKFRSHLSEMEVVLEPLLTIFNNRMLNPQKSTSLVIGLLGSPGVGKTAVGKVIADAWGMPFQQISMGGMVDSSILDGQRGGWVGSSPGRIAKALQAMGVINGVLFLDEIDKLGESTAGLQVQASLLHSIDPIQNNHYVDHYLGSKLPLDLSQCLIICALNKVEGLDPALLSRLNIIRIPDYGPAEKINIINNHLLPDSLSAAGLESTDVSVPPAVCKHILTKVGHEGGVRNLKACIKIIVDKLSLLIHTTDADKKELGLSFNMSVSKPCVLTTDMVDKLYADGDAAHAHVCHHMYI